MKAKILLSVTLVALLAAGCGSTSAGNKAESETETDTETEESGDAGEFVPALDTTAELTLNVVGSWGNFEALDEVALNFQEYYPNVEVVYTQIQNGSEDIQNMAASGVGMDIYCNAWYNPAQEDKVVYTDLAEDLNETDIDFSNLNSDMLSTGQVDGAQLLVPVYEQMFGMMVNYTLLEENDLSVPTNYAELTETCDALVAAGYEHPIFLAGSASSRNMINMVMADILHSSDPEETAAKLAEGTDEEGYIDNALSRFDELEAKGYFDHEADTFEDTYESVILRFFEGDVPFVLYSANNYSGTKKREAKSEAFTAEPFSYGFEPAPLEDDGAYGYMTTLGAFYMGVYKDSENLEYANELLRFMLRDDQMTTLADVKNLYVTMEHTGLESLAGTENMPNEYKIYPTEIDQYNLIDQAVQDAVADYIPGVTSHEEVLELFATGKEE